MTHVESLRGQLGRQTKHERIREALKSEGKIYRGEVLLVPSVQVLAQAMGKTIGYLYSTEGSGSAAAYQERLEEATGLTIIHKGGLVLAGEVEEIRIGFPQDLTATGIREHVEQLSPDQIARLIGHLASALIDNKQSV